MTTKYLYRTTFIEILTIIKVFFGLGIRKTFSTCKFPIWYQLFHEGFENLQVERKVPFLRHPAVPQNGFWAVFQDSRETSWVVQNGDILAPKSVVLILNYIIFLGQLGEVEFVGVALERGDVPVHSFVFASERFILYIIARNDEECEVKIKFALYA